MQSNILKQKSSYKTLQICIFYFPKASKGIQKIIKKNCIFLVFRNVTNIWRGKKQSATFTFHQYTHVEQSYDYYQISTESKLQCRLQIFQIFTYTCFCKCKNSPPPSECTSSFFILGYIFVWVQSWTNHGVQAAGYEYCSRVNYVKRLIDFANKLETNI